MYQAQSKDLSRHFSKDIQMSNKHLKRYSISLREMQIITIREMQIKTTIRYHDTSTRLAVNKKTDNKKYW